MNFHPSSSEETNPNEKTYLSQLSYAEQTMRMIIFRLFIYNRLNTSSDRSIISLVYLNWFNRDTYLYHHHMKRINQDTKWSGRGIKWNNQDIVINNQYQMFWFTQQTESDDQYQLFWLTQENINLNKTYIVINDQCQMFQFTQQTESDDQCQIFWLLQEKSAPNNNPGSNPCPNPSPQPRLDPCPDPNENVESKHHYSSWLSVDYVKRTLEHCTQLARVQAIESKFYGGMTEIHHSCLTYIGIHPVTPINGGLLPTVSLLSKDNTCKDKTANWLTSICLQSLASICFHTPFDGWGVLVLLIVIWTTDKGY